MNFTRSNTLFNPAVVAAAAALLGSFLVACGGSSDDTSSPDDTTQQPPAAVSYVAPEDGSFVAAIDPGTLALVAAPALGTYAGKSLFHTATVDPLAQAYSGYAGSTLVYKGASGGLFKMDLVSTGTPAPVALSSEANATIDDTCTYTPGPNLVGTFSASDFANPANSSYFYRLPGASGVCGSADDVVHMVHLGMSATDAPINALMPIAVARSSTGALTGFIAVQGATLTLFDSNFANPRVLYTAAAPISQAYRLSGQTGVAATGAIFVVDGNLVALDYVAGTASAPLFTLSRPTERPPAASSGSTLYFVDTVITGSGNTTSVTATLMSMPLVGGAAPSPVLSEPSRIFQLQLPAGSSTLVYSITSPAGYTLKALPSSGGASTTVLTMAGNSGSFLAVGANIYYNVGTRSDPAPQTVVFSNSSSGVVRNDGTVLVPPLANSRFAGNERTDSLAMARMFRVRGLAPVTTVLLSNGETITDDGVAGGTLEAIDTSTNLAGPPLGTVPSVSMTSVEASMIGDVGFLIGSTRNSTGNPATRELMAVNASVAGSLVRLSSNLP